MIKEPNIAAPIFSQQLAPVVNAPGKALGSFQSTGIKDTNAPSVKQFRHRWEMRMIAIGVIVTAVTIAIAVLVIIKGDTPSEFALGALMGLATPVISFFIIRYLYWKTIANGVEITSHQLPELYQVYKDLALEMGFVEDGTGLDAIPRLYLVNGNGEMNAFASKCQLHKGYVVIHSDIVDLAYTYGDFGAMRFVLAHELGHIKCRHVSLWRQIIQPVMTILRLSPSLSRAQEYSADRVALYYAGDCADSMILLSAGKNLTHRINMDEYYRSIADHKDGLWIKVANFLAGHAVGFRRMEAIRKSKSAGWDVHGKML
ncbi:MAG: M48 family metallopeptidase [Corynebacterium sp.]|uniref:M48 family metallopeptidase n=1 Tax=Corynebacterium sp. TaxID=1720 RepID=UPI0026DAFD0F|nr:M48 family metallopeptidase [Corynebacterium sp.]MDO4760674.1 M48 family metallopeptidase [Corynebacterium sp.]